MKTTQFQPKERVSQLISGNPRASKQAPVSKILQKQADKAVQKQSIEEENELLQGKFDTTQREEIEDEEEPLQGKFESAPTTEQEPVQREEKPNNTGLPDNLKTGIENLSGYNMDDVKVHYNSEKPAQLQALAYAQGTDIHVASGQEKHLPHEVWHVVQQKQGRVQPTMQLKGVNVNDNEGLEREADVMGGEAILHDHSYETNENSVLNFKSIIQRFAYWPTDINNRSINTNPVADQPQGRYIRRIGDNLNQRLFNRAKLARNSARNDSGWNSPDFASRKPEKPANGRGIYQYNNMAIGNSVPADKPIIARHDADPDSLLSLFNNDVALQENQRCRHWHAAISNDVNIHPSLSTAAQPVYRLRGNIEHYFINPFVIQPQWMQRHSLEYAKNRTCQRLKKRSIQPNTLVLQAFIRFSFTDFLNANAADFETAKKYNEDYIDPEYNELSKNIKENGCDLSDTEEYTSMNTHKKNYLKAINGAKESNDWSTVTAPINSFRDSLNKLSLYIKNTLKIKIHDSYSNERDDSWSNHNVALEALDSLPNDSKTVKPQVRKDHPNIQVISWTTAKNKIPSGLRNLIRDIYTSWRIGQVMDERNQESRERKEKNPNIPGGLRSWHVNEQGQLPDNKSQVVPGNAQALHDHYADTSVRPYDDPNVTGTSGYAEYTGTGIKSDYHYSKIVLDYKSGIIYLTVTHYALWSKKEGKYVVGNKTANSGVNSAWFAIDMKN